MSDKSNPYHYDVETKTLRLFFKTDAFLPPGEFAGAVIKVRAPHAEGPPEEADVLKVISNYEADNPYGIGSLYSISQQEYEDEWSDGDEWSEDA